MSIRDMLPSDKSGHLAMGFIAGGIGAVFGGAWFGVGWGVAVGLLFAAIWGVGKEYFDSRDPAHHTVDYYDALATFIGGVVAVIAYVVFQWLIFGL